MLKKETVSQQTVAPFPALKFPSRIRHRLWGRVRDLWFWPEAAGLLLFVVTVFGFLGRLAWIFELAGHWRLHYTLAAVLLALLFAVGRRAGPLSGMLLVAGVNGALLLPLFTAVSPPPATAATLRVVSMNIWRGNNQIDEVAAFLLESDADVIILSEVTPEMQPELQPLQEAYPTVELAALPGQTGRMLFSRVPGTTVDVLPNAERPSLVATLPLAGQSLTIIGAHTAPPIPPAAMEARNEHLDDLARFVQTVKTPVALFGDLNISPWSPYFARLLQESGLQNGRAGFGVRPTWPAAAGEFGIPIDHALVTSEITVQQFRTGPDLGSDHAPIIVDFSLAVE